MLMVETDFLYQVGRSSFLIWFTNIQVFQISSANRDNEHHLHGQTDTVGRKIAKHWAQLPSAFMQV